MAIAKKNIPYPLGSGWWTRGPAEKEWNKENRALAFALERDDPFHISRARPFNAYDMTSSKEKQCCVPMSELPGERVVQLVLSSIGSAAAWTLLLETVNRILAARG